MPGPLPKNPALRQRRNQSSTATLLTATDGAPSLDGTPPLPARGRKKWHALTEAWWRDVWASPMAPEYLEADIHGLYVLADLIDLYWRRPGDVKLAGEIRQQRMAFGLTPIDRRRLQWEIARGEQAERKGNPPAPSRQRVAGDPRTVLHAVK